MENIIVLYKDHDGEVMLLTGDKDFIDESGLMEFEPYSDCLSGLPLAHNETVYICRTSVTWNQQLYSYLEPPDTDLTLNVQEILLSLSFINFIQ